MNLEPANIIHAIIVWQSFLFALVLLTPKFRRKKSNTFLILMLITIGVHFTYNILFSNGYLLEILPAYSCTYGFLYGPLLYLHIKFFLFKNTSFKPVSFLHFIPGLFVVTATVFGIKACLFLDVFILPAMMGYCFFSFREISIYKKSLQHVSSKQPGTEIRWLYSMLVFMLVIILVNLIQQRQQTVVFGEVNINMEVVVQFWVLVLVNTVIYQGIRKPHSFQPLSGNHLAIAKSRQSLKTNAPADTETLQKIADRLEAYMKQDMPYTNPDLSINMLAKALKESEKMVSRTINMVLGSNFSEYINTYRIDDAMVALQNASKNGLSIKEIMFDVGFNSRSVFNTVFKKKTGLTPSEYKKKFLAN